MSSKYCAQNNYSLSKVNGFSPELVFLDFVFEKPKCVRESLEPPFEHIQVLSKWVQNFTVEVQQPFDFNNCDTGHPVKIRNKGQHKKMSRICLNLVFRR